MVFLVGGCHGFVCYAWRFCWFGSMTVYLLQLFVFCWFVLGCDCLVGCVLRLLLCLCWFLVLRVCGLIVACLVLVLLLCMLGFLLCGFDFVAWLVYCVWGLIVLLFLDIVVICWVAV